MVSKEPTKAITSPERPQKHKLMIGSYVLKYVYEQ
jgi:hypothetical protein